MTQQNKEKIQEKKENVKNKSNKKDETVEKLNTEVAELKDQLLRTLADMENLKKRTLIDIKNAKQNAVADLALDILPIADNLDRALEHPIPEELKDNQFIKNLVGGIQLTQKAFETALAKNKITVVDALDKPFDPHTQKAVSQVVDNNKPENTVLGQWQKGYIFDDNRILREAMVIVSKKE